jgi:DNA-binding NarL/FixJ family response regulator
MSAQDAGLLERSGELDRVRELIEGAATGRGSVMVIEGPAGIGKTSVLEASAELAQRAGLEVLRARAGQLEHDLSWNLVRQLFERVALAEDGQKELLRGAARLAAPALGLSSGEDTGALHGLYWLTSELARRAPLLLAVDDAHWGDVPSLRYLAYVAERVRDLPVLALATIRRGDRSPCEISILSSRAESVALRELSAAASAELARDVLGRGAAESFCDACHHATGGNPFLLRELLEQLRGEGVAPSADQAAAVARITPASVSRSVLLRLSQLDADSRELANAVAIIGDCGVADAAALAGITGERAAIAADALSHAGVLRPGSPLGFVHPIVREVIYWELPALQRARRHRDAAVLLAKGGDDRRAATQLLETEPEGDEEVVEQLERAADAALAEGAPAVAATYLERAAREPPSAPRRARLLVALGRAEGAAGGASAVERMGEALELISEPRSRAEILLERGRLLYNAGRLPEAAQSFDRGLRELDADPGGDSELTANLQAGWITAARLEISLRADAEELTYRIAADPPRGETYGERALLAQVSGQLTFDAAPRAQAVELAYRALGDGQLLRDETSDGLTWVAAMGALGWSDHFDAYDDLQDDAIADARKRGSVIGYATAMYGKSFSDYHRGRLSAAVADAEEAIGAEPVGWRHFLTAARAQLAWALIERDEIEPAITQVEQARVDAGLENISAQALILEARARIELIQGHPARALGSSLEAGRVFEAARITNPSILAWRSHAAIAAAAVGDAQQAEALLEDELRLAERFGAPRAIAVALTAAGVVRGARGLEALERAVELLADSPAHLERVRAQVLLGAALRRNGSLGAARDQLGAALDRATSLGATRLAERARLELTAAGLSPRRQRRSGVEALTPAELRVAEAAAAGMTNREIAQALFVSLRTVETHLTHCYQKLGIESRGGLSRAIAQAAEPINRAVAVE